MMEASILKGTEFWELLDCRTCGLFCRVGHPESTQIPIPLPTCLASLPSGCLSVSSIIYFIKKE
jgi:hypothetical protein